MGLLSFRMFRRSEIVRDERVQCSSGLVQLKLQHGSVQFFIKVVWFFLISLVQYSISMVQYNFVCSALLLLSSQ